MPPKTSDDDVMRRRIQDNLEDTGTDAQRELHDMKSRRTAPISPPFFKTPTKSDYAAERDLERGDYDAAPPYASPSGRKAEGSYSRGGMVKKHGSPKVSAPCSDSKTLSCK